MKTTASTKYWFASAILDRSATFSPSPWQGLCRWLFVGGQRDQSRASWYSSYIIIQLDNEWRKNFYQSIRLTLSRRTCVLRGFEFNLEKARNILLERVAKFSPACLFFSSASQIDENKLLPWSAREVERREKQFRAHERHRSPPVRWLTNETRSPRTVVSHRLSQVSRFFASR